MRTGAVLCWSLLPALIHERRGKINSPKFAVASNPSGATAGTPRRHGGTPRASKRGDYVVFVAPSCIEGLRLATARLLEKYSPPGPGLDRTSLCRSYEKLACPRSASRSVL